MTDMSKTANDDNQGWTTKVQKQEPTLPRGEFSEDGLDYSFYYCQGCGAAPHTDGSHCGPRCPVQLFPVSVSSVTPEPEQA